MNSQTLHGVINGDTIRLSVPSDLPAGTSVQVIVIPEIADNRPPLSEGVAKSFGILSKEEGEDLDRFLAESRQWRRQERRDQGL
jgi:hypothetical protein